MSDIKIDKQKIADYWDMDVLDDGEQIADILTIAERAINRAIKAEAEIESLKAITELALNKFKEINIAYMLWIDSELDCDIAASRMDTIAETTLSEIARLSQ